MLVVQLWRTPRNILLSLNKTLQRFAIKRDGDGLQLVFLDMDIALSRRSKGVTHCLMRSEFFLCAISFRRHFLYMAIYFYFYFPLSGALMAVSRR